ncbi:MAG TPA: bifunctional phosphopantothenoylcysteine decarboxylase/phosphopantothenate--cysteine ligase CoaBC [Bacteroidales bacterium]|jgi:phosphopantothenoylcysteine decarboxylase/phosphopantothenate--cysteine ligase|nr:bifunctional phosphopantothenoylcysteine decarboxylase/phosphopantothenate--cysteine ligase CoaBC [Bacteroidales bacterium]HOO67037.1 bifunctional phosphopantothenoylcysteine decarboxylase/phosphopantothenate--cysteine ligase CoaBC [Bacteroidales bacterium]HPE22775.1 bifunctional phosphopantothenoylcysteine decarboxylase/phosphopantothenate--cysteine ligase CoaBC [Bacteroidales bacterium]HPJ04720.1 bifunctional phosphopantothenoylcysteine decarboxylase/phosphopantothenate--cysteine ligase Coa
MLKGRKILLGVTGGIAAYKAAVIIRLLVREGAEVKVIMTPLAKEFITPLTLATLSKNPVLVDFFNPEDGSWNSHIDLGLWADLFIIAPATANTMGKMAAGIADNLLLTTCLSARCPVLLAPAMDLDMLAHPATVSNIERLKSFGNQIIEPDTGELASGLEGKGRMAEPEVIVKEIKKVLSKKKITELPLQGRRVMINAGPTVEPIDPVRFISNHSSGRMGIALADEAARLGAEVTLVLGPVSLKPSGKDINIVPVETASEMKAASLEAFRTCDIAILAAAVADFTPEKVHETKMKRGPGYLELRLKPTEDIAASLGGMKKKGQILAGFALETENETENARAKLQRKNLDLIILNSLRDKGAGFGYETNRITIIDSNNNIDKFELKSKEEVASDIFNKIISLIH